MTNTLLEESLRARITPAGSTSSGEPLGGELHIRRITRNPRGKPVVLLHGPGESGAVYYARQPSGLAYALAEAGFDVFIPDFRGRGKSLPRVKRGCDLGLADLMEGDLPAIARCIQEKKGESPAFWGAHSLYGLVLMAWLSQQPTLLQAASGIMLFGVRRQFADPTAFRARLWKFQWLLMGRLASLLLGYWPARLFAPRGEPVNESSRIHRELGQWVAGEWLDPARGTDLKAACQTARWPAILHCASSNDRLMGHPDDVREFMRELGSHDARLIRLDKKLGSTQGASRRYRHGQLVSEYRNDLDHGTLVSQWLASQEQKAAAPAMAVA